MSWRLSKEMRDLIADFAYEDPEARGNSSGMLRKMVRTYALYSDTRLKGAKGQADLARYKRQDRLEEVGRLRQDYLELKENPNPGEERAAQARAEELGLEWPPKAYSELDLSMILLRLKRLWRSDGRLGSINLRDLHRSLRRGYSLDRLFQCLKELENRGELLVTETRPVYVQEVR